MVTYQIPPINGAPIYSTNATMNDLVIYDFWQLFEMTELTEVLCQREDLNFIGILN